jgi:hypothetical protein
VRGAQLLVDAPAHRHHLPIKQRALIRRQQLQLRLGVGTALGSRVGVAHKGRLGGTGR